MAAKPAGIDTERNYVTVTLCIDNKGKNRVHSFLLHAAMLARYMLWPCVHLSQVGLLLKRLNTGIRITQTKPHDG